MANSGKVLQVRLQEKIDTLTSWLALDTDAKPFIPLAGEKINVKVPTANSEADGETIGYEIISKTGDGVLGADGVVTGTRFKDLPWDSALAADVYDWAKAAVKPSYTYDEIDETPTHRTLTIKDADSSTTTNAIVYNPIGSANQTLTLAGSNGVTVNATTNKITVSGTTANGTTLGQVKGGVDVSIASGEITVNHSAKADNATSADSATTAGRVTNSLVIKGNGTTAETFDGSAAGEVNIKGSGLISVAGNTNGTITISTTANNYSLPAAGDSLGGVKTGGVATISGGQITAISEAAHAGSADTAATAATCSGNATTATTANKTKAALTFGTKTFNGSAAQTITAADLGLSTALKFKGVVDDISTVTSPAVGDVWLVGDKEYVYVERADGTKNWEDLGDASALADAVVTLGAKTVGAGDGLTGGGAISGSPTLNVGAGVGIAVTADAVKAKLRSETALTLDSTAATTTSGRVYPVAVDKTGYLAVNVPWTDKSVTSAANHYTPATDTNSALNAEASSTTAASWGSTDMVTGVHLQRDSKGHVTGMTVDSIQMPSNPNTDKTNVIAGVGLAGGGSANSSSGVTVKAKLRSETALANDSAAATETAGRIYPVATDKSGYLAVNVPWNDTTYNNATTAAAGLMSADDKAKLDGIAAQANKYSLPLAASGTRGGIKIGYSASGANIPV